MDQALLKILLKLDHMNEALWKIAAILEEIKTEMPDYNQEEIKDAIFEATHPDRNEF